MSEYTRWDLGCSDSGLACMVRSDGGGFVLHSYFAARVAELEREVAALREQIDPESVQHWDAMRKQRDQAQSELRELQHVVWHLLDDTEDRAGRELVVPRREWERLGELVPEDHPAALAPRSEA